MRERELRGTARQGEPGRLAGQPQRRRRPARHGQSGDGEGLRTPLGGIHPGGHLDQERAHVCTLRRRARAYDPAVLEIVYTGLLVIIFAFITWFSVYVVYKLYQGQS
jgi:hypothetical protein